MAIANRLARVLYKILSGDSFKELGLARASKNEIKIRNLLLQLKSLGVNIEHKNHELIYSTNKIKVDGDTGEIIEERTHL